MNKLQKLTKSGHHRFMCYLIGFVVVVFWVIVRVSYERYHPLVLTPNVLLFCLQYYIVNARRG